MWQGKDVGTASDKIFGEPILGKIGITYLMNAYRDKGFRGLDIFLFQDV